MKRKETTLNLLWTPEGFSSFDGTVIGCDEVGRGCMAGPVVAACVAFDTSKNVLQETWTREVRDSKLLTEKKKIYLADKIKQHAIAFSICEVSNEIIDEINIHKASLFCMKMAVDEIHTKLEKPARTIDTSIERGEDGKVCDSAIVHPTDRMVNGASHETLVCVDGKFLIPNYAGRQVAVVDGDAKIFSIAASSIIAKVYRDELVTNYDKIYPGYGFAKHKGYGTRMHAEAIEKLGLSPIHRKTFVFSKKSVS